MHEEWSYVRRDGGFANEVVDMQQQLQVVNEVVVDHLDKIGGLEEQNARLKKIWEMRL